jgi:hypothetical protein
MVAEFEGFGNSIWEDMVERRSTACCEDEEAGIGSQWMEVVVGVDARCGGGEAAMRAVLVSICNCCV